MPLSKYDIALDMAKSPDTSHAQMASLVGSNKRVLDVGCDTGYLGEALMAAGNTVSGVEYNPEAAAEAAKRLTKVVIGDLESLDLVAEFGEASFDVVMFGDVLEHLRDPLRVLRQARPLLAPGGAVVISLPNIAHGDVRLALLQGRFDYTEVGILDNTHTKFFTRDSLARFLGDAGFVLAELRRTQAPLFGTEIGVREEDFDPALVARLRADVEATTYQFVVSAVPDDATTMESRQALRLDELAAELERERRRGEELQQRHAQLEREHAEQIQRLQAELERAQTTNHELARARDELAAELAALEQTKTMRATRSARRAYGYLRR